MSNSFLSEYMRPKTYRMFVVIWLMILSILLSFGKVILDYKFFGIRHILIYPTILVNIFIMWDLWHGNV